MASVAAEDSESLAETKTLTTLYSKYLKNLLPAYFSCSNMSLLGNISSLYRQVISSRSGRRKLVFPLPLPAKSVDFPLVVKQDSPIFHVLDDVLEHIFLNLHKVQNNLRFWQLKAEGSSSQKACFMFFQRGPRAFVQETAQLIQTFRTEGSSLQQLSQSVSSYIVERITILDSLRYALAKFLAKVYLEIEKHGEDLVTDPQKALPSFFITLDSLFSDLESSLGRLHDEHLTDSTVGGKKSFPLLLDKLSDLIKEGSQLSDSEVQDATNLINQNLHKLDCYLAVIVAKHKKPTKYAQHWVKYTCGAIGLSACSLWLIRHSRLVGSPDLDNWVHEARESTIVFWNDHVEQPLISIRDELFETFRKRHKGVMEAEEVQLTANSLHRMLLAFSEQTKGQKLPENASDQEMLEIVMNRYEKELMHPIQNLFSGELARALLIQVQKLKMDIETAMLELDQILRANEINFAVLAALPAFFLSLLVIMLVRSWIMQDKGAQGRGRIARRQRRLLVVEVEKRIMQYQNCLEKGQNEDADCMFGLLLYSLDLLYHAVERHAKATGEWICLRQDIIDLGKPGLPTSYKLTVTSRLERSSQLDYPNTQQAVAVAVAVAGGESEEGLPRTKSQELVSREWMLNQQSFKFHENGC
ncbi:hypothetical protein V2J09_018551 [Rumex salicifolius]